MPFHHEGMVLPPGVEPGGESLGGTARSVLGAWSRERHLQYAISHVSRQAIFI
jgi:hypothetical protein